MSTKVRIIKNFYENPNFGFDFNLGKLSDKAVSLLATACRFELAFSTRKSLLKVLSPVFFRNADRDAMVTGENYYAVCRFAIRKHIDPSNISELAKALKEKLAGCLKKFWTIESSKCGAGTLPENRKLYVCFDKTYFDDCVSTSVHTYPAYGYTCYTYEEYRYLYETLLGRRSALKSGKYSEETVKAMADEAQSDTFKAQALNILVKELKMLSEKKLAELDALRVEERQNAERALALYRAKTEECVMKYEKKMEELKRQIDELALAQ